jgi:hypothetical protein
MRTLIKLIALGALLTPIAPALARPDETASPGTYMPGSFYAPMHSTHDKGASIRANQLAARRLREDTTS